MNLMQEDKLDKVVAKLCSIRRVYGMITRSWELDLGLLGVMKSGVACLSRRGHKTC